MPMLPVATRDQMKRSKTAHSEPPSSPDARPLKRANSSLFSIATLVDQVDCSGASSSSAEDRAISGLAGGRLDGGGAEEESSACDDDGDDLAPPDDFASSSCSSSDVGEQEDDENDLVGSASSAQHAPIRSTPERSDNRTGLVFESGSRHFDRHNRLHKERPLRITAVRDYLAKAKPKENEQTVYERCQLLEGRGEDGTAIEESRKTPEGIWLDDDDYLRVHLPGYMRRLDGISKCNCHSRLDVEAEQYKSIYFTNDSVREAKAAASSLCNLVSRVASGELDNGFAVIRPPGHHAEPGLAGGYCVINNIAVAAAYAREKLGVKKILIVDWDVHHGNGTQKCFIDNPNVLYFSAHRYHGGNFFPFLQQGGPAFVGAGAGEGKNMNVGWNEKRIGDDEYLVLWEKLLMPVAAEFGPDLILVSAGFDAAKGDMGECDITPEGFARLTRRLKTLACGKVVCTLEGGYVRSVLCKCVESVLGALLDVNSDEKCEDELAKFYKNVGDNEMLDCIDPSAAKSIRDTMKAHAKYWDCLADAAQIRSA